MKNVGINNCQDVGQNRRRHIGHIALRENKGKKNIKSDKDKITEDRIPDADDNKLDLCPMSGNQIVYQWAKPANRNLSFLFR